MESPYPKIDKLRKKFETGKKLTLNEACFILWADQYVCSDQYLAFQKWVTKEIKNKTLPWAMWEGLFDGFVKESKEKEGFSRYIAYAKPTAPEVWAFNKLFYGRK